MSAFFDFMEDATFRRENTKIFYFFAWMKNPNLLPRSKVVTFFSERGGRSSASDGPPLTEVTRTLPPSGGDVHLLIHQDHFYDWSPQQDSPTPPPPLALTSVAFLPPHRRHPLASRTQCSKASPGT
jgi:hypothetical protein